MDSMRRRLISVDELRHAVRRRMQRVMPGLTVLSLTPHDVRDGGSGCACRCPEPGSA
jgi:hypothetical protein